MNALHQLTNVERAAILHQLFPDEIPALLDFISGFCSTIKEDEERNRQAWKNGIFTFDFWLNLLNTVEERIKRSNSRFNKSHWQFSEQLFDGFLACFTICAIQNYVTVRQHDNKKFMQAVDLLFDLQ